MKKTLYALLASAILTILGTVETRSHRARRRG